MLPRWGNDRADRPAITRGRRGAEIFWSFFSKKDFFLHPRGTTRTPGADPARLPIGLDLRALSIVEGVRAGLAAALPVAASVWLDQPILSLAALGALLTCICDPGGPLRRRLPLLIGFVTIGALLLGGFGLVRSAGIALTLAAAAPALFGAGFLRIWGAPAAALGNLLAVVLLLGTDAPLDLPTAAITAALFAAGGIWALLLTLLFWQLHPYGPARRAVADVWDALAAFTRMLLRLVEAEAAGRPRDTTAWEIQARAGRGAVRNAIENARAVLQGTVDTRGSASGPATQNLLRLEAADQLFAVLVALSDLLEYAAPEAHAPSAILLRRLRPLLRVIATATERERADRLPRLERAIATMRQSASSTPALVPIARTIADRLLVATKLIDPAQYLPGSGAQGDSGLSLRQRIAAPIAANLSWRSATLRHAARICVVVTAALAFTLLRHGPYTHWLTITLVLVMQPFFATTWQRTLERVGGTLLGGTVAAALSAMVHTRMHLAGLLPVLGALALAVRQVSYGVYIAVYTPVVILLVEQIRPLEDQTQIALARAGYTILGGLLAVAANAVLWPSWQKPQVDADLATALRAHADYARTVLLTTTDPARARRLAGLTSNNLEATLQRAMHEPRRGQRDRLQAVLVADTALRRIAGRLTALSLEPARARSADNEALRCWVPEALAACAGQGTRPAAPAIGSGSDSLDRLARQVELLETTLGKEGLLS